MDTSASLYDLSCAWCATSFYVCPRDYLCHQRAAARLAAALAVWRDPTLRVALSVDAKDAGFCLGLTDELGVGMRSVYYEVEVIEPEAVRRRRRGIRIPGVGDFRDLRQLRL